MATVESQLEKPKFDSPPSLNPLAIVTKIYLRNYVLDIYNPAKFHPDRIRGFVSVHARWRLFEQKADWISDLQKAILYPKIFKFLMGLRINASNCLLGYLFVFWFFKSSKFTAKTPARILTQNTANDAVPRKNVTFGGRKTKS